VPREQQPPGQTVVQKLVVREDYMVVEVVVPMMITWQHHWVVQVVKGHVV
jgi:hypothetical protein